MSKRTANNKLTKVFCQSRKRSPKRIIVLVEPNKVEGHKQRTCVSPHFRIRSGATVGEICSRLPIH